MTDILKIPVRNDSCCYLEYLADVHKGKFNRYRCGIAGTTHECKHWGWCPIFNQNERDKTKVVTEHWDIRVSMSLPDFEKYTLLRKECGYND